MNPITTVLSDRSTTQPHSAMMMVWPALCVRWIPNANGYWFDFDERSQETHKALAMTHGSRALPEIARLRKMQAAPAWLLDVHGVAALIKQGRMQVAERRIDALSQGAACAEDLSTRPAHAVDAGLGAAHPLWLVAFSAVENCGGPNMVPKLWTMGLGRRMALEPHLGSSLLLLAIAQGAPATARYLSEQGVSLTPADRERLTTNLAHLVASDKLVADDADRRARSQMLAGVRAAMAVLPSTQPSAAALMNTRSRGFKGHCMDLFKRVRGVGADLPPRAPALERPKARHPFFRGRGV